MGRYRHHSAEEDSTQRSKRKRTALNGDNLETASAALGTSEGKRALYHCNYCNKDISGKIRIKCVKCPDFDLCVECFSVGAEVTPHKSNHSYRVMDNLSFPLICPDWNADEEILLLEGIEMYGLGNWAEIAEHVGTKNKAHCIDHYTTVYMNSPCFPLPDMSHVVGKNRKELLAMAKGHGEGKKGFPTLGDVTLKEEFPFSPPGVKIEEAALGRSPSNLTSDVNSGLGYSSSNSKSAGAVKKASNMTQIKDDPNAIKMEDSHLDRSIKGNKPKSSGDEEHSMAELSGYNCKRQEFDPEYDNDAEQSLAEMEFKDTDTEAERELKLRVLHIYLKRLDERKRRKDFILERNLLYPDPLMKELPREEREIYLRYKVFMRFHSKEEHKELLRTVIEEYRIRKKIQGLQEARAAGCRTSAEAEIYLEQMRKKEIDEISRKDKESAQASSKGLQRLNNPIKGELDGSPHGGVKGTAALESSGKENSTTTARLSASSLDDWDVTGLPGSDLLSETEQHLCCEARLLPVQYLKMQEVMSIEIFNGNITKKPDAHRFFGVDPRKVDKIFDMLQRKGISLL